MLVFGGNTVGAQVGAILDARHVAREALLDGGLIYWILIIYVLLIAVPFVPGAEIGFMLILVLGAEAAGPVYLATVAALTLSYGVGRLVPEARLQALALRLGLARTAGLMEESRALTSEGRAAVLMERVPTRWLPWLIRHRRVTLALLINTPGNTVLGGGGGISLVTGASRLLDLREFLTSVSLAVAPVPAFVLAAAWMDG